MDGKTRDFAKGVKLHRAGDLKRAEQVYRRILRVDPWHADALHLLGVIAHQRGDHKAAVESIGKAISINAHDPVFHNNLGAAYQGLGRLEDAVESYQQSVQLNPESAQAQFTLGATLLCQHNWMGAQARFQQAIRLNPRFAEAHCNLGTALHSQGRCDEAAACFSEAIHIKPDYADAHLSLGNLRLSQSRLLDAVASYMAALEIRRDHVEALNNLGTALTVLGKLDPAIKSLRLALQISPGFVQAHNNLGNIFNSLGRHAEAEACYRDALRANPEHPTSYNNLGAVLNARGLLDEAASNFRRAIELSPDYADAHGNLAAVLQVQGLLADAEECYRSALRLTPSRKLGITWATMLPPIYASSADLLDWRDRLTRNVARLAQEGITLDPARELIPINFYLPYQGLNDRGLQQQIAGLYSAKQAESLTRAGAEQRAKPDDRHGGGLPSPLPLPPHNIAPERTGTRPSRIRIAFISNNFKNHTIGHFMRGIIARLSRADFHVTVLSVGEHHDEVAEFIRRNADSYAVLPDQIPLARSQVAEIGADVLCFPDVGMDPVTYTLAFSRLAPVQCVTWGHPVTTGIPNMDYFLSSELLETAGADEHYSETLVRLKSLPTYYYRPVFPRTLKGRAAFGLPEQAHVYLCPQSLFKFHPDFDTVMAEILRRDSSGCLALIEAPHANWTSLLSHRLRQSLGATYDRVQWVPRLDQDDFLNLMAVSDVMLDPLHFGGGNTSYQALSIGLPIVTLPSAFLRGRVTAACYRMMGLFDCIARNTSEYIDLAVRFGTDPQYQAQISTCILAANSVLFEDTAAVEGIEQFFRSAVEVARGNLGRAA